MADMKDPGHIANNNNLNEKHYEYSEAWCRTQLRDNYLTTRNTVGHLPGMKRHFSTDDGVLVGLLFAEENVKRHTEGSLEGYLNLLQLSSNSKLSSQHVLLIGEAGVGKSALVNHLVCSWAKEISSSKFVSDKPQNLSSKFKFLFALDCKRFKVAATLEDCIHEQLLPSVPKTVLKCLLRASCNKSLFLFDGFDESLTHKQILDVDLLRNSCVIVTTRPNRVDTFNECYSRYKMVQLEGLSVKRREAFVTKYLDMASGSRHEQIGTKKKADILIDKINKTYIGYFSFHPLLLAMISIIWNNFGTVPTRMTSLYKQALEISAQRVYSAEAAYTDSSPQRLGRLLLYLGRGALDGLLEDDKKLVFSRRDFSRHQSLYSSDKLWVIVSVACFLSCLGVELGLQFDSVLLQVALVLLGIAMAVHILFNNIAEDVEDMLKDAVKLNLLTLINPNRSGADVATRYCFVHKTFQEYTAAVYLTSLVTSDKPTFEYYLRRLQKSNAYDHQYFLRFCCGLNWQTAEIILEHVVDDCKLDWRLPVTLVFEADTDLSKQTELHDNLRHLTSLETYTTMSSSLWAILNHYLCQEQYENIDEMHTWLANVEDLNVKIPPSERYANHFLANASKSASFCEGIKTLKLDLPHQVDAGILTDFLQEQVHLSGLKIQVESANRKPNSQVWMHSVFSRLLPKSDTTTGETPVSYFDILVPQLQSLSLINTSLHRHQWERLLDIFLQTGRKLLTFSDDDNDNESVDWIDIEFKKSMDNISKKISVDSLDEGFNETLVAGSKYSIQGASQEWMDDTSKDFIGSGSKESFDSTSKDSRAGKSNRASIVWVPRNSAQPRSLTAQSKESAIGVSDTESTEYVMGATGGFSVDESMESITSSASGFSPDAYSYDVMHNSSTRLAVGLSRESVNVGQLEDYDDDHVPRESPDVDSTISILGSSREDDVFVDVPSLPLRELDLRGNHLFTEDDRGDVLLSKFAEALSYMPDLEHIGLTDTGLTTTSMQILGPAISKLSNLKIIDICTIEDKSNTFHQARMDLSRCLNSFGNLGEYDLHCSDISDEAFGMLSLDRLGDLEKMKISSNAFGSQGLVVCSTSLRHVPFLTKLKLTGGEVSESEVVALSNSLYRVQVLTKLDLSAIEVELKGLLAIGTALKNLPLLNTLKLNASKIKAKNAYLLSSLLQHTSVLKRLSVILGCYEALIALTLGFLYIPKLTKLQLLSKDHIPMGSVEALFTNLFTVPELQELIFPNIETNYLSSSNVVKACLQEVPSLQAEGLVYLRKTDIRTILSIVNTFSHYKESVV